MRKRFDNELGIFLIVSQLAHKHNCGFKINYRKKEINFYGSNQNKAALIMEMQEKYGEECYD